MPSKSKFKELTSSLGIDEKFTAQCPKETTKTTVKGNIARRDNYNFMMDLLSLPKTKEGYLYLLVSVDLYTDKFDIEPLKNKEPKTILVAFQKMFKRPYLKKPYASVTTDGGSEFKSVFHQWLWDNNIRHKVSLPDRHNQLANVESLNRQLGRIIIGLLNEKEKVIGETYREWLPYIGNIREKLNQYRIDRNKEIIKKGIINEDLPKKDNKYKVGDLVTYKLDAPRDFLGHKQPTKKFREGDVRWNLTGKKIKNVYLVQGSWRYILEGLSNVSYTEAQLKKL